MRCPLPKSSLAPNQARGPQLHCTETDGEIEEAKTSASLQKAPPRASPANAQGEGGVFPPLQTLAGPLSPKGRSFSPPGPPTSTPPQPLTSPGAVPPGVELEKPREERSGERRHRRYSHVGPLSGHQRRHASAAAPPASGRFPRTSVRPQSPARHAGNGLPPLLRDVNVLKVPASKQNCILGFGVLISRLHFVLNTQYSELAGDTERKASPTVVKCRHR